MAAGNSGFKKLAVQWLIEQTLSRNPLLRQAVKRQSSLSNRTSGRKIFKKVKLDEVTGDWFIGC